MLISKCIPITCLCLLFVSACGVPSMIENTVETKDGSKITVDVIEAKPSTDLTNPVAHMLFLSGQTPPTRRKATFIEAAELKSGCSVLDETFTFVGGALSVAAVELDCSKL